jgi:GT2 family glycosyltransferase
MGYYLYMKKVTLVQMVYNGMRFIPKSFDSMVSQNYGNIEIAAVINGNDDGGKEYIIKHYPQVKVIDPGENLKFVRGHNFIFNTTETDFFQLVNQDLFLEPNYVEEMVKVFDDPKVGAANGKIYQYDFDKNEKINKLDTTGVSIYKSGRARSRGQNEVDNGQYDKKTDVMAVDGAACMYRKEALDEIRMNKESSKIEYEYFDEDFEMYWEDVDLAWRMVNAGWRCKFVPTAIGYHGRTAGSSEGGYKRVIKFIKHHSKFPLWIRQFNYKNHIFLFLKNSPKWYWQFFVREFFMLGFILVFEIRTLGILPKMFRQLPSIWRKRRWVREHGKVSVDEMEKMMG